MYPIGSLPNWSGCSLSSSYTVIPNASQASPGSFGKRSVLLATLWPFAAVFQGGNTSVCWTFLYQRPGPHVGPKWGWRDCRDHTGWLQYLAPVRPGSWERCSVRGRRFVSRQFRKRFPNGPSCFRLWRPCKIHTLGRDSCAEGSSSAQTVGIHSPIRTCFVPRFASIAVVRTWGAPYLPVATGVASSWFWGRPLSRRGCSCGSCSRCSCA